LDRLLWRTIHKTEFNKECDFLETILTAYGIEDINSFLNVNKGDTHNPFLFRNMKQGIELLHSKLGGRIYIKRDTDVDGLTSSAHMKCFINDISPETEVISSTCYEKEHGIFLSDIEPYEDIDLIIVPDAGSASIDDCKAITEKYNIPILILDHHKIDDKVMKYATLINCTDGVYPNDALSGVGVVHKFCLAYARQYGIKEEVCNKYLDLVALGMIADSMDMRNLETRYYALEGLKEDNRHNSLIKELALANEEEMKMGHTLTNYGWVIAPKLNGAIRYGKEDEQNDLFRAICGEQENREYQPRRVKGSGKDSPKPPVEIHTLQKTMARVCANIKARQDKDVREFMKKLDEKIQEENLNKNSVIIVDGTDILTKKTVTGLVGNKLAEKYQRPVVILKSKDKDTYGGSGRGYEKGAVDDFNSFLNESNLIKCEGHPNAFGVTLHKKELSKAIEFCNKKLKLDDLVTIHEVDYEVKARNLTPKAVMKVAEAFEVWGKGVGEPTFVITEIEIPAKEIQAFGDNNGFIKFTHSNVSYIKKYCSKGEYEAMTLKDRNTLGDNKKILHMTIIGNFTLNEYEGNRYPQVKIKYFESEEYVPTSKNKVTIDDDFLF
jgi:single-stranded-DNA-specific exonuclease